MTTTPAPRPATVAYYVTGQITRDKERTAMTTTVDIRQQMMVRAARARVSLLMARAAAHNARLLRAGVLWSAVAR